MSQTDIIKIFKLSLGSSLAIFIAWLLDLDYYTFAGIITLLTVKNTKRETIKGALGKVYGFILCTIFSYICFNIMGYNLFGFSSYICIIIFICFLFKIQEVIAMCVVISSHYFIESAITIPWIVNEAGLFIIGAGIGVIINLYMPSNINKIYEGQKKMQDEVSSVLVDIAYIIANPMEPNTFDKDLNKLSNLIEKNISIAYDIINNNLLSDTRFFLDHMEIIKNQRDLLKSLYEQVYQLTYVPEQAYIISQFIYKIGNTSYSIEKVNLLLDELDKLIINMKKEPLPTDRIEFENRAILFLCLIELEKFLNNRRKAQVLRDNKYNDSTS